MSRELAQTRYLLNYRAMSRELNYRQAHTDADPGFVPRWWLIEIFPLITSVHLISNLMMIL